MLIRFMGLLPLESMPALRGNLLLILAVLSIGSMTLGNLAALRQENLRRMLAYSSIAHAGYMMMAVPPALAVATTDPQLSRDAVAALALACTALAYLLYFRLIAHVGPAQAIAVTYLIPAFAIGWGMVFLGERVTLPMLAGCAIVLLGTALATGMLGRPRRR